MKRKTLLLCVLPILLAACSVRPLPGMELSRRLIVEAIGIDAAPEGVTLTLESIDPSAQQTDTKQGKPWRTYSYTARSVAEAANMAAQHTGKTPFFAYAGVLLFGREAAEQGLMTYLDFFLRNRTVRNTVEVCIAYSSAESILNDTAAPADSPARMIEQAIRSDAETGQCAAAPFFQFVNRMFSPDTEAYCPLVRSAAQTTDTSEPVSCTDTAVFNGDRLYYSLDTAETQTFMLLNEALKDGLFCVEYAENTYDCRMQSAKTKLLNNKKGPISEITVRLRAKATIVQINGVSVFPASKAELSNAKLALEAALPKAMEHCLDIIYKQHGTDMLRIRKKRDMLNLPANNLQFICTAEIIFK